MKIITNVLLSLLILFALPLKIQAQESSGQFGGGSVIIGYDNQTCVAGLSGAMRYNSSAGIEFCDGSDWSSAGGDPATPCSDDAAVECLLEATRDNDDPEFTAANIASGVNILGVTGTMAGGCTAPVSCPSVGDVCADGSLFAGFILNSSSCAQIYVTDDNQSASSQWKTANGTNDITDPNDHVDGQYNRDNRGGGSFPAFEICEDNTYHSKNDWYLPARDELHLLWKNSAAIDANAAGNFTGSDYWSSTEEGTYGAWNQSFSGSDQDSNNKTDTLDIRCIRRVDSPGGGGGACDDGGLAYGAACWYFAGDNVSCTTACSTHGGYDPATQDYAGSSGSLSNCQNLVDAFLADLGNTISDTACPGGLGCTATARCTSPATTAGASFGGTYRFCACMN